MSTSAIARRIRTFLATIPLVVGLTAQGASSSVTPPLSGEEIVAQAVRAHGGSLPAAALRTLEFEVDGRVAAPFQSYRVAPPSDELPLRIRYWLDFGGKRAAEEYFSEFPGGYRIDRRAIVSLDAERAGATEVDHRSRTYSAHTTLAISSYRYHPLAALRQFAEGATFELLGTSVLGDRRVYEVAAASATTRATLLIDSEDYILRGVRVPRPHPLDAQGVMTVRFLEYTRVSGWLSPARAAARYLAEPKAGFDVDIRTVGINSKLSEAAFAVPVGYIAVDPMPAKGPHVRELSDGVYLVERLLGDEYNALVVELSDSLLLVEAPLDDDAGRQLREVAARIGHGKPVKHLVLTHAHEDHIGGLRAVLESKPAPTVISTMESEQRLRAVAAANGAASSDEMKFEAVVPSGRRILSDKTRRVEIINLGPNPHTAELLVVYLPGEKILFQADMLTVAHDQVASPPGNAGTVFLDEAICRLGLDVAYVAGAHGVLGTRYDLERSARLARAASPGCRSGAR